MFYTIDSVKDLCVDLKNSGKIVVLVTGFFDLLHQEHINFLKKARVAGDVLIIAVESDGRARALKGEGRPVETQELRSQNLTKYGDYIIKLDDSFNNFEAYESLMLAVSPHIYAVSSHSDHLKSKTFLTEKYGGKLLVVHEHNPEISTTKIIKQGIIK